MDMIKILVITFILTISTNLLAEQTCPDDGKCLTKEDKEKLSEAIDELIDIKRSEAKLEFKEPIIILRDWDGRVYINGGDKKPTKLNLKIGETINRDLEATLPIQLYYREKPEDPIFRLRFRANFDVLVPELIQSIRDEEYQTPWSGGLQIDLIHYDILNLAVGVETAGFGVNVGVDITKNFGVDTGFLIKYDKIYPDFVPTLSIGTYFSF